MCFTLLSLTSPKEGEKSRTRSNSFSGKIQEPFSIEKTNPFADKKRKSNSRRSVSIFQVDQGPSERGGELRESSKSGTAAVYDHRSMPTSLRRQNFPMVSDDDLTVVEVSDMRIAEELFCKRHLRPPLPVGIPDSK